MKNIYVNSTEGFINAFKELINGGTVTVTAPISVPSTVLPPHGAVRVTGEGEGALCFEGSHTLTLGGDVLFENIKIKINTTGVIGAAYHALHFGTEVEVECDMTVEENGLYLVGGLNRAEGGECQKNTDIRLESGSFSRVVGFSRYCAGRKDGGHASLFIGGSAYVRYAVCGSMGENETAGSASLTVADNAVIEAVHLAGARKENFLDDVTLTVTGGDVYRFDTVALLAVKGKKHLIYDPERAFDGLLHFADLLGFDSIFTVSGKDMAAEARRTADTVFIKDGAKGGGLSPDDPTGSLERAFEILAEGGTLVLCGRCTVPVNTVDHFGNKPDSFQEPRHEKKIKLTCVHNGVDYRPEGAALYFPHTMDYRMSGPLYVENAVIKCADGACLRLVCRYNELYIGEDCKTPENGKLDIIGGFMGFCRDDLDGIDITDPMLEIVGRKRPLPRDYDIPNPAFIRHAPTKRLQKEAADAFDAMFDAMEAEGLKVPDLMDTQRPFYRQYALYSGFIGNHRRTYGYSFEKAKEVVLRSCGFPGTSEHHYGVAVDMHDASLTEFGGKKHHYYDITPEWSWVKQNGAKYGIILRFPADKTHITGCIYEAWHFRYVGKTAAFVINTRNITLEEYVGAKYGLFHRESRVTVKSGHYNSITQFSRNTGYIQLTGRHFLELGEKVTVDSKEKESSEC